MHSKINFLAIAILSGCIQSGEKTGEKNVEKISEGISISENVNEGISISENVKDKVDHLIISDSKKNEHIVDKSIGISSVSLIDTLESKEQMEVYSGIRTGILENMEEFIVSSGDTLAQISNDSGLTNYEDLVLLNGLLGKEFKYKKGNTRNILLRLEEKLFVPKTGRVEIINNQLSLLKTINDTLLLNQRITLGNTDDLSSLSENIYPNKVRGVGVEKMLKGFIGAQQLEFDPYLPHIVDVARQETVSCANLIRTLLAFSVDRKYLTEKEISFFRKQGLDAWILPEALKNIGYVQSHNLMNNFSSSLIGGQNPIPKENQENYEKDIIELGKYLETNGVVGSILPLYFRYSHYKGVVASYNRGKKEENRHYNTHQTLIAGTDSIVFDARKIGSVKNLVVTPFDELTLKEMTIFEFLTNFIQQRGDYGQSALSDWQKKLVEDNLLKFYSLINIKVNGIKINLLEEFSKNKSEMLKIKPNDKIELSGPIMIDGLHMVNSSDDDKRKNMNARTRFYFEFIVIGNFLPSELLEPQNGALGVGVKYDEVFTGLETKGVYALKRGDTVESAIKDKILRYEKDRFDSLDKSSIDYEEKYNNLLNYYFALQIKALKITGFMQSENDINKGSFNINAPIPYFSPENISDIFTNYVAKKKQDIKAPNEVVHIMRSYVQLTTLPLDSYKSLVNRLKDDLVFQGKHNSDIFPSLYLFSEFNELQQRKFLELFINKSKKSEEINVDEFLNGKIQEGINMILGLKEIDKIVFDISNESYSPDLELNFVDEFVIDMVVKLDQNNNILQNILSIESYTPEGAFGGRRLLKQLLENNKFLQFKINFDYYVPQLNLKNISGLSDLDKLLKIKNFNLSSRINSHGDYQLRFTNLNKGLYEEWPNKYQLLKAFSYLETSEFLDFVDNIPNPYVPTINSNIIDYDTKNFSNLVYNPNKERIKDDLKVVSEVIEMLDDYDSVDKYIQKNYLESIKSKLESLLLLDDGTGSNIVGKVIGTSLINDNINLHFQKLNGILQASGEKINDIYHDKEKMKSYEKVTILINNLGERNALYGLTENYLIRIFQSLGKVLGTDYSYPKLDKTSISGQFIYGNNVFKNDLLVYKNILGQIKQDLNSVYEPNNEQHIIIISMITELDKIIDTFSDINSSKFTTEKIYDLFKNEKIKSGLLALNNSENKHLYISILPLETEFIGIPFRQSFFRYVNTRDIVREGPGLISKFIPGIG